MSSSRAPRGYRGSQTRWGRRTQQITPPTGPADRVIKREELSELGYNSSITDCSYVASYNWLDEKDPVVMIPGKPPAWAPPATDRPLKPDKGRYYRDQNAARYPPYPMEAAIRAVLKQEPGFPIQDIDIVTCNRSLENLLRFVCGNKKDFRIILASVGTTVFLLRQENSPMELITGVEGYGHNFLDEYTTWEKDVKKSASHQRIIQYRFGGLHLLLRFEVDGYQLSEHRPLAPEPNSSTEDEASLKLSASMGDASMRRAKPRGEGPIQIKDGGHIVPQDRIFDVKTRSIRKDKESEVRKFIPRLWISQIPSMVVARHDQGLFENARVENLWERVEAWETENADRLSRLASLLHELVQSSRTSETSFEIYRSGTGPLEIRPLAVDEGEVLPPELKKKWIGAGEAEDLSDSNAEPI